MKRTAFLAAAVVLAGAAAPLAQQARGSRGPAAASVVTAPADAPEVQLKLAVTRELVDGDAAAAIERYREIESKARATAPAVAAQALMQAAASYERLGRPEAREVYRAVVRDYGALPVAMEARERLGPARPTQSDGLPRRIATMVIASVNDVTADGSLAVGSGENQQLFVQNLGTGQVTPLGHSGSGPVLSADGRAIAYTAEGQLRILPLTPGATPRTLVTGGVRSALDWLPDGSSILAVASALVSVAVADGRMTTLRDYSEPCSSVAGVTVSPDGAHMAYSRRISCAVGAPEQRIYVARIDGQGETEVGAIAGSNTEPVWTPDGSHLVFVNSRVQNMSLWAVPIAGGRATGVAPTLLRDRFEAGRLLRISHSGTLYDFRPMGNPPTILIADRSSGSRVTELLPGGSPSVSPDGKYLALLRVGPNGWDLVVRELATSREQLYWRTGVQPYTPRWFRDGTGLVVVVVEKGVGTGTFHAVELASGTFRPLFAQAANGRIRSGVGALSNDNATFYVATRDGSASTGRGSSLGPWTELVAVSLTTGEEQRIFTFPGSRLTGRGPGLALSPDGSRLAITAYDGPGVGRIFTVGVDGANYGEVHHSNRIGDLRWTPDGESILFLDANSDGIGSRVMRVPALGGEPVPDDLDSTRITSAITVPPLGAAGFIALDLSRDGSLLVVGARVQAPNELWALDDIPGLISGRR